jgi:RHS repeat-associated protein
VRKKVIGLVTALAILASGLVSTPAYADENPTVEPPAAKVAPTSVSITSADASNPSSSAISVKVDALLEDTDSIAYLYNTNSTEPVDSVDKGEQFNFTVLKPMKGTDQYKVVVNNISSNIATVNNISSAWKIDLAASAVEFGTADALPKLTWTSNISLNNQSDYTVYVLDITTGSPIFIGSSENGLTGEVEIPTFTGAPHDYAAYVARPNISYPSSLAYSAEIASNSIQVKRKAWTVDLEIDKESFSTDGETPTLTWKTNQPLLGGPNQQYFIHIVDLKDGSDPYSNFGFYNSRANESISGTSGTVQVPNFTNKDPHSYRAYIVTYYPSYFISLSGVEASSGTVSTELNSWTVDIESTTPIYTTDEKPTIKWSLNQQLIRGYDLHLYDETDPNNPVYVAIVGISPRYNPGKTGTIALDVPAYTGQRTYRAYIAPNGSGYHPTPDLLNDVQAVSNATSIEQAAWDISISTTTPVFAVGENTKIEWVTNQSVTIAESSYKVYIVDETINKIVHHSGTSSGGGYTRSSTTGTITNPGYFESGEPHTFKAYIAKDSNPVATNPEELKDIRAISNSVTISRLPWTIGLEDYNSSYGATENVYRLRTFANQYPKNGSRYGVYVVNEITGEASYMFDPWSYTTFEYKAGFIVPSNETAAYRSYVAVKNPDNPPTRREDLQDIQAVSGLFIPGMNGGPTNYGELIAGSNPSEASCNQQCHGDPVNSATGEFYENNEDLAINTSIPFTFARNYSAAQASSDEGLGYGWSHGFDMKLKALDGSSLQRSNSIQIKQENSSTVVFVKDGKHFIAPNRVLASLTYKQESNEFSFERKNGYTTIFDGTTGKLKTVKDRNENNLVFDYNAAGNLIKITSNDGKTMEITWNNKHITEVKDYADRTVKYTYDNGDLVQVRIPEITNPKTYTYDEKHLVTSLTTADGATTTNVYDDKKRVIQQTNPVGGVLSFNYKPYTTTITAPDGSVSKEEYNNFGQLVAQYEAYGTDKQYLKEYSYGLNGQTEWQRENGTDVTYFQYDAAGNMTLTQNALGQVTTFTYNDYNQILTTTNPANKTTTNTYDSKGNLVETKSFGGKISKYEINPNGTLASIQNPREVASGSDKKTRISYDGYGFVSQTTSPEGLVSKTENNSIGQPTSNTDAAGNMATNVYNAQHALVEKIYPNGSKEKLTYNDAGQVVKQIDRSGQETSFTYNLLGNIKTETSAVGTTTHWYNTSGQLIKVKDFADRITTYSYDEAGNIETTTDPQNHVTKAKYDANARLVELKNAKDNVQRYQYNAVGQITKTFDALDQATIYEYNNLGLKTKVIDPLGSITQYQYDDDGALYRTTQPDNTMLSIEYDLNGSPVKKIMEDGTHEGYTYDADGKVITSSDKAQQLTSYVYNAQGLLETKTTLGSDQVSYAYDDMNQLQKTSYDNWATIDTAYSYNLAGQTTQTVKKSNTTTYKYDELGNLTYRGPPSEQDGTSYQYKDSLELQSITYPSGTKVDYSYNLNSDLTDVTIGNQKIAQYQYDETNLPGTTTYGNGVTVKRDYNANDQLTGLDYKKPNSDSLYSYKASLNPVGMAAETTEIANGVTTTKNNDYDSRYRVTSIQENGLTSEEYEFDASNNLSKNKATTQSYNILNQLTSVTSQTKVTDYFYDTRGNRTSQLAQKSDDSSTTNYTWTANNQLSSVTLPTNKIIAYTYDENNLLQGKSVTDSTQSEVKKTEYVWDNNTEIPRLLEDSENLYIYGSSALPAAQVNKDTKEIQYLHTNNQGSVVAVTDDDGNQISSYQYDAYGNTTQETGDRNHKVTPFAYVGEYLDTDTGLYFLRARWYEPSTGTFISKDPANKISGESYSYASGNPLFYTDPLGLMSWNDASQFGYGALNSATFGLSTLAINAINPNLIDECNSAFFWGGVTADVASMVVPGIGMLKATKYFTQTVQALVHSKIVRKVVGHTQLLGRKLKANFNSQDLERASLGPVVKKTSIYEGEVGSYSELTNPSLFKGDGLTAHHMPSKGALLRAGYTPEDANDLGGSIVMTTAKHARTRTFGGRNKGILIKEHDIGQQTLMQMFEKDVDDYLQIENNSAAAHVSVDKLRAWHKVNSTDWYGK